VPSMADGGPPIDPKELRPLHYSAGLCLHACQQLEYDLKYLVWLAATARIANFTSEEATDLIEGRNRKTLGQVLSLLRQRGVRFSPSGEADLARGLAERNRFVHGFLIEQAESIIDPRIRPGVVREIRAIRKAVLQADSFLRLFIPGLQAATGLEPATFEAELAAEARALNATVGDAGS